MEHYGAARHAIYAAIALVVCAALAVHRYADERFGRLLVK
jgi:hypothetical protein